jgi:hypothetical protein
MRFSIILFLLLPFLAHAQPIENLYSNKVYLEGVDAVLLYNPCPDFLLNTTATLKPVQDQPADLPVEPAGSYALISYSVKKNWFSGWETDAVVLQIPARRTGSKALRALVAHLQREGKIKDLNRPDKDRVVILSILPAQPDFYYSTAQDGWFED